MKDIQEQIVAVQDEIDALESQKLALLSELRGRCSHNLVVECVDSDMKNPQLRVSFRICAECGLEGRFGKNQSVNMNTQAVILGRIHWNQYHHWKYSLKLPFVVSTEGLETF